MDRLLVWVPAAGIELLGELPDSVEIAPIPDDPLADHRLAEVALLVLNRGFDLGKTLAQMTGLRVILGLSAGVETIMPYAPEHVIVCSGRGANSVPVAEWAVTAVLAGQKELAFFRDAQRDGRWDRHSVARIEGSTILILGYGAIAKETEVRLAPFKVNILRVARRARPGVESVDQLDRLLPLADVVIVLLPLTDETQGFLDAARLAMLPDGALVVNASRGRVIDTDALLAELSAERLRAVLDVTEPEPLPKGHPLFSAPGLLLTPHIAGHTPTTWGHFYRLATTQIRRFADGEPLENVVEAGY